MAQVIESVSQSGRYLLLRQARVFEEASQLPAWLEEVFFKLEAGKSPKVFVVAQIPVDDKAVARLPDKIAAFRMRSMEPSASEELLWKLISAHDSNPDRWTDAHVEDILGHCGGTPELMVAIIKIASKLSDLSVLSEIIGTQAAQFSDTLASLASWAFGQLDGYDDEKRALLFLNDVSPVALQDIEGFLHSNRSVSEIVGRLMSLGLVEQSEDGLLRLSPLLSRRLSSLLTTRELVGWHRTAISEFANQPFSISDGEMGYIRVEARIKAELYSGRIEISPDLKRFVSHAHYFQIGVRLYNARRYGDAFRILRAAFAHRSVFDLNAGIELARFYCLSAIRLGNRESDVQAALMFLRSRHQGQSMADFLEGERLRFDQRYDESLKFFEKAQKAARDNKERYREERIIRPYLESILSSRFPNFAKAKALSDRGVQLAKTFYSLAMRARVYLRIWQESRQSEADAAEVAYRKVLLELQDQPGASSFYAQARSEEAEAFGNFDDAIDWMKVAIESNSRAEMRLRLWSLQIRSSAQEERSRVLKDIEQFCADAANRSDVSGLANAIAQRYARALNAQGELKQFRISQLNLPLSEGEVRKIFLQEKDRARQH